MRAARTLIALAAAAPWVVWAGVRGLGLDGSHPLPAALAFTPYAAATSWVPVLVALVLGRRRVALLAAAGLVALGLAVLPRALGDERVPRTADGATLRVLTFNAYEGRADMAALLRLAQREGVDVLSLQELTPAALARFDAAGGRELFPGRAVEVRPGSQGSGLLAREPLTARGPDDATAAEQPEALLRVPRAAPVRIKALHPQPPVSPVGERRWRASLARLPRPGRDPGGPLRILAGDFNATLDHAPLRRLLDEGYADAAAETGAGLVHTWRRGFRRLTIDHVLLDRRLGVRSATVHDIAGSDHRAVVAELVLPAQ